MLEANQISSYIYRFQEAVTPLAVNLFAIGRERKTMEYSFEGLTRDDPGGAYLFQYTISGYAVIRVGDQLFRLDEGKAFFVPFRSDYHYYLPEESDNYECLFATLDGNEAHRCWQYMNSHLGPVHSYSDHSSPIRMLSLMYQETSAKKVTDTYKSSMIAYQFLMELYRYCRGIGQSKEWPAIVTQAVRYMDEAYRDIGGLDDVAKQIGISKFHLIKLFNRNLGKTPIEYLTKKRMEIAVELLRTTNDSLDEISQRIGYQNVNYFSKVFRKMLGVPPGKLRKEYDAYDFMFD